MAAEAGRLIVLAGGEGDAIWFIDNLATVKADASQTGGWSLIEMVLPAGHSPPPHVHHDEAEAFYVLEGTVRFRCGEETFVASPGSFVYGPAGVPHGLVVEGDQPARALVITEPSGNFASFVRAFGKPAKSPTLPVLEGPPDVERLNALAAQHKIEILGPPPSA
jgi:quercetin dioxygenase-like cupin family protein